MALMATTLFSQHPKVDFQLEVIPDFFHMPADANLIQPTGAAVNSHGHIFVFNKGSRQLMEFDPEGNYCNY